MTTQVLVAPPNLHHAHHHSRGGGINAAKRWISSDHQHQKQVTTPEIVYMGRVINADEIFPSGLPTLDGNEHRDTNDSKSYGSTGGNNDGVKFTGQTPQRGRSSPSPTSTETAQEESMTQNSKQPQEPSSGGVGRFDNGCSGEKNRHNGPPTAPSRLPSSPVQRTVPTRTLSADGLPRVPKRRQYHQKQSQDQSFQRSLPNRTRSYSPTAVQKRGFPPRQKSVQLQEQEHLLKQAVRQEKQHTHRRVPPRSKSSDEVLDVYANKLSYTTNEINSLFLQNDQEFAKLKASLHKRGAVTNETLRQGLHFYVRSIKTRQQEEQAKAEGEVAGGAGGNGRIHHHHHHRRRQKPNRTQSESGSMLHRRRQRQMKQVNA